MSTARDRQQTSRRGGDYVDVGGVATYYEVTGTGNPVVLLHGGMCTAETFDAQALPLAERYRVVVPERFGHGRTRDIDGPLTYENMAQHTIGFLEALGIGPVLLAGWSDGALVGLLVALRRADLVRKLALIDQFVTLDGARQGYKAMLEGMSADRAGPFADAYGALSPDGPDHFRVVFAKLHAMWRAPTGVAIADLAHVSPPTLLLAADGGCVTYSHLDEVSRVLVRSQVAVVPGTSHALPMEKPQLVNQMLLDFLADEQAPTLFPRLDNG